MTKYLNKHMSRLFSNLKKVIVSLQLSITATTLFIIKLAVQQRERGKKKRERRR